MLTKNKVHIIVSAILLTTIFNQTALAKSVYAITDHGLGSLPRPAKIAAYGIDDTLIEQNYVYELDQDDYPDGYPRVQVMAL